MNQRSCLKQIHQMASRTLLSDENQNYFGILSCRTSLLRKGPCASQIKSICSCPVPLLSAKSVSLYFYGTISRGPSKEARPLGRLLLSLLPVDAKLSISLFSSFYCASAGLFVSAFVVVELAGIRFFLLGTKPASLFSSSLISYRGQLEWVF